jgi:hypothetical protein
MTTYLTKIGDKTNHHFRVTTKGNGVDIVHGIFYRWLGKYFEGCGGADKAIARQKELVQEKLSEGYIITEFIESPENTLDVYDKAEWHFGGNFPDDLEEFQGYVHTGMFLGWLVDNDLVSTRFGEDHAEEIQKFMQKEMTGATIFETCCDGALMLEDLNETGNRFALPYFDFAKGQYLLDYENAIGAGLPSLYHVEDTWENYEKLKTTIDQRFSGWQEKMLTTY